MALSRKVGHPLQVIPKHHKPNKRRRDYTSADGHSANDGILKELAYASVDEVVAGILRLGRGTAKMDIKASYRSAWSRMK